MTGQRLLTWPRRGRVPAGDGGRLGSLNISVVLRVLGRRRTLRQRDRWTREQLQAHQARALRQQDKQGGGDVAELEGRHPDHEAAEAAGQHRPDAQPQGLAFPLLGAGAWRMA